MDLPSSISCIDVNAPQQMQLERQWNVLRRFGISMQKFRERNVDEEETHFSSM